MYFQSRRKSGWWTIAMKKDPFRFMHSSIPLPYTNTHRTISPQTQVYKPRSRTCTTWAGQVHWSTLRPNAFLVQCISIYSRLDGSASSKTAEQQQQYARKPKSASTYWQNRMWHLLRDSPLVNVNLSTVHIPCESWLNRHKMIITKLILQAREGGINSIPFFLNTTPHPVSLSLHVTNWTKPISRKWKILHFWLWNVFVYAKLK